MVINSLAVEVGTILYTPVDMCVCEYIYRNFSAGGSPKSFPGLLGMDALVIPAPTFWVKFVSDG